MTGTITNTAFVSSGTTDTNGDNDSSTATTPVSPAADLQVMKDAPATVNAGELITYTLTVFNHGPSEAQDVTVTDTLPSEVTFASATGCTEVGGVVTCDSATLERGKSVSHTIVVTVAQDVEPGTSLENNVVVGSATADGNELNNSDDADTSVVGLADQTATLGD